MAIRDVVTMGFGSFSRVNLIPVLGYGLGNEFVAPSIPGAEAALDGKRTHFVLTNERTHFSLDSQRLHYAVTEE